MGSQLTIERVEVHQFEWEHDDLGYDYNGFNWVYKPGSKITRTDYPCRFSRIRALSASSWEAVARIMLRWRAGCIT